MDRRRFLSLPVLAASGLTGLAGCSGEEEQRVRRRQRVVTYGDHPSQYAELWLPDDRPRGVVVVIHGGFWKNRYDLTLGQPLADSLARQGWAAWNLEYRRVGGGGGVPATLDDVAAGIDRLAGLDPALGVDLDRVITLGHSAGGHLATWAASRGRDARWPVGVAVTGVVSQAGVLDLRAAHRAGLGDGAVKGFLGRAPGPADDVLDPIRQVPLDVPVLCVHGRADEVVPISQSRRYVKAATAAGATAELVPVAGEHFAVIDTATPAWQTTLELLQSL